MLCEAYDCCEPKLIDAAFRTNVRFSQRCKMPIKANRSFGIGIVSKQ